METKTEVSSGPSVNDLEQEAKILAEEKAIAEMEKEAETDDLFAGLDEEQSRGQREDMDAALPAQIEEDKKHQGKGKKRGRKKKTPVPEPSIEDDFPAPPPQKKRKQTRASKQFSKQAKQASDTKEIRQDPTFKTLAAYGRSALLGPVLEEKGYNLSINALMQIPLEMLPALLDEVDEVLDAHSVNDTSNFMIAKGMENLEKLVSYKTKYRIKGTTEKCFQNSRWLFQLERAKFKMGLGIRRLPFALDFALLTANIAAVQHDKNSSIPETDLQEEAPTDLPDEPVD